jgi:hypothetical protein
MKKEAAGTNNYGPHVAISPKGRSRLQKHHLASGLALRYDHHVTYATLVKSSFCSIEIIRSGGVSCDWGGRLWVIEDNELKSSSRIKNLVPAAGERGPETRGRCLPEHIPEQW